MIINPYLNFPGNTEEAFNFYKSIFGGEFVTIQRFKDIPGEAEKLSAADGERLMHISLTIGQTTLMGTDLLESRSLPKYVVGNNVNLSVHPDSREDADKIFKGLSEGGTVTMPMSDVYWGDYFGMLVDKYGINWLISFSKPKV